MKYWKLTVLAMTAITVSSPAQNAGNHNPAFSVPNTFIGGEPYIFIGEDDSEVFEPRTPVGLQLRNPPGQNEPYNGSTTLQWSSSSSGVLAFDGELSMTGFKDEDRTGDGDTGEAGDPWTWTNDNQANFHNDTIFLQGSASAQPVTVTLESFHSKDPNDKFTKDFTLLKVDLTADPGKIHLGFDPPNLDPASGENDDPSVYWASVVQGGTNNIVNLNMPGGNFSNFEWIKNSGDGATVSHDESATGDSTDLTITATGSGSAIQEPEFYLVVKGSTQPLLTLNVMVLPQRTLPLAVYEIEDPTSPDTTITGVPSIDDFVTICNDVFKQAGVQFTAVQQEGHDLSGTIYYPYDTREIYNYHYVDAAGAVDREPDTMLTRSEQEAFFNTPLIENPEYRVFTRELEELGGSKDNLNWALFRRGAISYSDISADPPPGPPFTRGGNIGWLGVQNLVEDLQLQLALAHEVAHVLVGDSIDDDGGYHDLGPYPEGVEGDEPNGVPPEKPGNAFSGLDVDGNALFETEHLDEPNPAILSPGTPANGRLPWPYGRWMRNEEWKAANEEALSREIIINNASGGQ